MFHATELARLRFTRGNNRLAFDDVLLTIKHFD